VPRYVNTKKYVTDLILNLNHTLEVYIKESMHEYLIMVKCENSHHTIMFRESEIDDFEIALSKDRDTPYFFSLEGDIKFKIYIELQKKGWLPKLNISNEIINEKRKWLKTYEKDVKFGKKMTGLLADGLLYILNIFNSLLQDHKPLPLGDIERHKKNLEQIYGYYKKNNHLNSAKAGIESLQYLKAAAVSKIIELESQKEKTLITRIAQAIDEEIYYIVDKLRGAPFLDIKLPDFIITIKEVSPIPLKEIHPSTTNLGKQVIFNDNNLQKTKPKKNERFDVAFSLAHEQHKYVDVVFEEVKNIAPNLNVFYYRDEGQEVKLWGRNMVEYLQTVYRNQSDHVIIFVSLDYLKKRWAQEEWRSVQEAILDREEEYLLPARFDDTELPGLHKTIAYVDLRKKTAKTFAKMIVKKITSINESLEGETLVEQLIADRSKSLSFKESFQRESVSNIKDNSIELHYIPDPTTIKLTYGHYNVMPYNDPESFNVVGKIIKIKDEAILKTIEFYVSQPHGWRPIVEYLRVN